MKIKNQLLITHGILVVLALVIVFINISTYKSMENDADIINQAGRLRMLSYNMAQISNQIILENDQIQKDNLASKLKMRIDEFDTTLTLLNGKDMNSNSNNYPRFSVRLETISDEWHVLLKPAYFSIVNSMPKDKSCEKINGEIDAFVNDINEMVSSYSIYAREKITRALIINGGLVLVIIVVTFYSFISTYKGIRKPLKILMRELKALSLVDDEVSKRLKNMDTDEISEMSEYFNEMMYDQLTKTFNRRAGLSKLSRMAQYDNRRHLKLSLCFIDINGLKEVNDQLGHQFGDELIVSTVDGIKVEIREEDFIIRMGGDEFLVVFNGIDCETAEKVWMRIKHRYDQINIEENRKYMISVSHGIVDYGNDEISEVELLIKSADDKMYAEKKYIKEELNVQIIKSEGH
ncbi:diguanylate cyclase [Fusibacter ferrireducens]|uniref:Diguanylate cyclase n=1 Tax=Fusibacter ferrireducens TaxID=2785058 RepID=A0ABR9ZQ83_9FIRM|nr:diguanylate cyclase [Fusibacter ferrireducens]MBF4692298.1 diguanylate cyclase [Fusibacter ferrireducens]